MGVIIAFLLAAFFFWSLQTNQMARFEG
jgi:hypothetical protein